MKYLFTFCFLVWEAYLRLRGRWRRQWQPFLFRKR